MLKKFIAGILTFIILGTSSISAFAGQTDNIGNMTQPAINTSVQQNQTSSAIKTTGASSKGAISKENVTASESAIASGSAITSGSALSAKNTPSIKKPDFDSVFNEVMKSGTAVDNGFFITEITSPDKDKKSTYTKSYALTGNSQYSDVVITIAKFNEETGEYQLMKNTKGESSWDIGGSRLFSEEITLTEGPNKIKILAYRTSQKEEALKENIQVNCYSILLLKEEIIPKVIRKTSELLGEFDILKQIQKNQK